ncbi:tail fiber domain-containing protein [Chitinophaga sp. XS-30]|uniref:tail fiber domain-containing protein n=1 Tax=Chitinophaga sp. XS-30 TaxID=2604421 RepID=UPI0011DD2388|nr:tail fiber domain-containing protein [Chitinophaga sp. XS-30]QEH43308.1 tail fiber domain-containing protein [Chitinophaga sp. XS-30]
MLTQQTYAQHVYQIRADSVRIYNVCDTAELIIENRTRGVNGFLYNKGNGRTEFRRLRLESIGGSQIAISGQDTLDISTLPGIGGIDTIYRSGDNVLYVKKGVQHTIYAPLPSFKAIPQGVSYAVGEYPASRISGFNAYSSPDMPVISDQALTNPTSGYNYYAGHVAWNGSAGYQMAVNWDGELTGPKGVFIRNKDDTKTTWGAWRELVFKDYADGKYWHSANHASGTAFSPVLTGANVPASFTSNASGHVTGFTTRALTAGDISAAPATGSNSYIQNQIASVQTANAVISGTYTIRRDGNNAYSNGFQLTNAAANRGANIQLTGDATPGLAFWLTNSAGTWNRRMAIAENGEISVSNIPAWGTAAARFLTVDGQIIKSRTAAQVLSDIGAAPATGSGNYIRNGSGSEQAGGSFWVQGIGWASDGLIVRKDGSNAIVTGLGLRNNAGTRGVNFQMNGDANPGLSTWLHNGTTWVKYMELLASGRMLLNGAVDDGGSALLVGGQIRSGSGSIGNARLVPGTGTQAGYLALYNGSNTRLGYIGYDNTNISYAAEGSAAHRFLTANVERMQISSTGVGIDGVLTQQRNALNASNDAGIQLWNSLGGSNLYPDPEFRLGNNSLFVYNNAGGSAVQLFRENAVSEAVPNYSGYYLRIQIRPGTSNGTTPGLGGVTSAMGTAVNQVYVTRIRAKIPSGYSLQVAANAFGTGQEAVWLTDRAGNGKWKDYMVMWRAGSGGTFSTVNYFYIEGTAANIDVYVAYFDTKNTNAAHWTDNVAVNHSTGRPTNIYLNTENTYLGQGTNYGARIGTTHGYIDIGPQNTIWAHFTTDRDRFYFNKELVGTTQIGVYNGGTTPTTFMQQNEMRVNDNVVWHAGNINFATKGANIGLKTEANGYLGIENWIRIIDGTGFFTSSGKYFYNNAPGSWAMRSGTGLAASWLELQTGEGTNRGGLYANSANDVGIVNANGSGWRLRTDASGNAYVTGQVQATSFYQSSLRSLKKSILPFNTSALSILSNAQVRTFQFKADTTGKMNIGFIADEVPEEMSTPGRTGVDQASTVALLVKSVQELNEENKALKEEVQELKAMMKKALNEK